VLYAGFSTSGGNHSDAALTDIACAPYATIHACNGNGDETGVRL